MDNTDKIVGIVLLITFGLIIGAMLTQAADEMYKTNQLEATAEAEHVIVRCKYCGSYYRTDAEEYYESIAQS